MARRATRERVHFHVPACAANCVSLDVLGIPLPQMSGNGVRPNHINSSTGLQRQQHTV